MRTVRGMIEQTLHQVETPLGALRYYDVGGGDPLLLLHGSGPGVTGWRNFQQNLPALSRRFRCLVLELPGFGVSEAVDLHPMVAAPRAVRAFLTALGLETVDVVGNSMGGVVALQLATRDPGLFKRIVTVGGVGTNLFTTFPSEGITLLQEFVADPSRERLVQWLHSMVWDRAIVTEEMIEARWQQATEPSTLAASRRMYSRQAMDAGMKAAATTGQPPYWAMLHQITAPVLLTWGREDRVSPLDQALVPMRTIPDATLHVLPKCGHWAMIEQQRSWESAVLAFLTREDIDG